MSSTFSFLRIFTCFYTKFLVQVIFTKTWKTGGRVLNFRGSSKLVVGLSAFYQKVTNHEFLKTSKNEIKKWSKNDHFLCQNLTYFWKTLHAILRSARWWPKSSISKGVYFWSKMVIFGGSGFWGKNHLFYFRSLFPKIIKKSSIFDCFPFFRCMSILRSKNFLDHAYFKFFDIFDKKVTKFWQNLNTF